MYLPAQTKLSVKLQKMWLRLAPLSAIDDNVRDLLPWLLMHHSVFVKITKFRSVFAAFILYYQKNCPIEIHKLLGSLQLAQQEETVSQPEVLEESEPQQEEENTESEISGLDQEELDLEQS